MKKYVITGGPCSGKTKTIAVLGKKGYFIIKEAAREVLTKKFKGKDSKAIDRNLLQREIFKWQEKQIENLSKVKIAFFDRGFGDTLAYYLSEGLEIPFELFEKAKKERYTKIFFLEPLNFYKKDKIRAEEKGERERIQEFINQVYKNLGYEIVRVPFMSVNERVKFIEKNL